jgi:hypothetical protein
VCGKCPKAHKNPYAGASTSVIHSIDFDLTADTADRKAAFRWRGEIT